MTARLLLFCAVISLLACACSVPWQQASTSAPGTSDFEASIARLGRTDPGSPAVLSAQLAYADFLLSEAAGPCA